MKLSEQEILLFKKWIEQGSQWNNSAADSKQKQPLDATRLTATERLGDWWNKLNHALASPRYRYVAYLSIPLLLLVLAIAISAWDRRKTRLRGRSDTFSLAGFKPRLQLALLSLLLVAAALLFQFGLLKELTLANETLESQLADAKAAKRSAKRTDATLPPHPMHPKRLGGVYYRGNDERSPQLFNGGFYRTATMEVWLMDASGRRLGWNDDPGDSSLFISFSIVRAVGTTSSLFSKRVMNSTFLTHQPQPEQTSVANSDFRDEEFSLNEIEPGESWEAVIPVGTPSHIRNENVEGLIHVHHGRQVNQEGKKGRIHFTIKYQINTVDGKISPESEIWMGSLYNLNGRVLIPDEDSILLDRWFDFRPIPEIEGSNTTDPTLLGIPEHTTDR